MKTEQLGLYAAQNFPPNSSNGYPWQGLPMNIIAVTMQNRNEFLMCPWQIDFTAGSNDKTCTHKRHSLYTSWRVEKRRLKKKPKNPPTWNNCSANCSPASDNHRTGCLFSDCLFLSGGTFHVDGSLCNLALHESSWAILWKKSPRVINAGWMMVWVN